MCYNQVEIWSTLISIPKHIHPLHSETFVDHTAISGTLISSCLIGLSLRFLTCKLEDKLFHMVHDISKSRMVIVVVVVAIVIATVVIGFIIINSSNANIIIFLSPCYELKSFYLLKERFYIPGILNPWCLIVN